MNDDITALSSVSSCWLGKEMRARTTATNIEGPLKEVTEESRLHGNWARPGEGSNFRQRGLGRRQIRTMMTFTVCSQGSSMSSTLEIVFRRSWIIKLIRYLCNNGCGVFCSSVALPRGVNNTVLTMGNGLHPVSNFPKWLYVANKKWSPFLLKLGFQELFHADHEFPHDEPGRGGC